MSYRITDKRGRTIGYARDQGLELAGILVGSVILIGLAIVLVPFIIVGYGAVLSVQGFLIFWDWATGLPLTPFPNLNGVLVITVLGVVGGLLVRYVRIHLVLLFSLGHMLSLLMAIFMATFWIIVVLVAVGTVVGVPILAVVWLFSLDMPLVVVEQTALRLSNMASPWLAPILFPLGWICAKIIGIFDKNDQLVTASNLTPSVGANFLLVAILSWMGMLFLHLYLDMSDVLLLVFGPLLGVALWGGAKGVYKFAIRGEQLNLVSRQA